MVKTCGVCGSSHNVQYVFDSFCESGEWRCTTWLGKRFPEGSRIVKFTDKSHPLRPAYYMSVETQEDLDLIMIVGQRAQKLGAIGMEACFYASLKQGRPISPESFSLGHADSELRLRAHIDSLRMHLETAERFNGKKESSLPEVLWSRMAPITPVK